MIQETHTCNGVKYGTDIEHGWNSSMLPVSRQSYWKIVHANNKSEPQWVGVSEEEYLLSEKGFSNESVQN